jgi:hypothetical protein
MAVFSVGSPTSPVQIQNPPPGELVAATPLGRDADGNNLTAYIVRDRTDAPRFAVPRPPLANNNDPKAKLAAKENSSEKTSAPPRGETSARFIKPDALLSREEQAEVEQLRQRDHAVRGEADEDAGNVALLTSYVYGAGPDGRRYALGVSAPLLLQNAGPPLKGSLPGPTVEDRHAKAAASYRALASTDASGERAAIIDWVF